MVLSDKLRSRLLLHFKTAEAMEAAARDFDIGAFREACGGSERRAAELISEVLGIFSPGFLATERAVQLHDDIIGLLQGYAHTPQARNRLRLLRPLADPREIRLRLDACMKAKERVHDLKRPEVEAALVGLGRPKQPSHVFDPDRVLLVEDGPEYDRLARSELARYLRILPASDPAGLEDAEVIVYVCSEGRLDLTRLENLVTVPSGSHDFELVPETVLDFFSANRDLLSSVGRLRGLLGQESACAAAVPALDRLVARKVDLLALERAVLQVRDELNAELRKHAGELRLSGDEVLEVLGQGVPRKVRELYARVLATGKARLRELTGYERAPYLLKYPVEVDEPELERFRRQVAGESGTSLFEEKVKLARKLLDGRQAVEREIREALEFDFEHALGAFAEDFELVAPGPGPGFTLEGCAHLALARLPGVQRVDYSFGGRDNAVLLTGANSGGKSTLLEALAQAVIMARCGLPVCARRAELELPEELYFFSQQKNLNAGAFEGFLRTLVPAVAGKARKLVLADELEAMTELEAGARIVAAMIERVRETDSAIIVVTHMAREISKFTHVRTDGIEARGLDGDYNLVVDRTPRRNYLARSTPELILRRLAETSAGEEKEVFRRLLESLKD